MQKINKKIANKFMGMEHHIHQDGQIDLNDLDFQLSLLPDDAIVIDMRTNDDLGDRMDKYEQVFDAIDNGETTWDKVYTIRNYRKYPDGHEFPC